ncbi:hypothetical protein NDS46_14650 [Paenibacillus thiaminolyticus]|nr:hypothetical protein [Paenibacillus thiaminolyticus]WCF05643.1 hypothetical protein NDS46_14650 [Paenibacillus thiaminolyticus]
MLRRLEKQELLAHYFNSDYLFRSSYSKGSSHE